MTVTRVGFRYVGRCGQPAVRTVQVFRGGHRQSVREAALSFAAPPAHHQAHLRRVRDAPLLAGVQRLLHQPDDGRVARTAASAAAVRQRESTV